MEAKQIVNCPYCDEDNVIPIRAGYASDHFVKTTKTHQSDQWVSSRCDSCDNSFSGNLEKAETTTEIDCPNCGDAHRIPSPPDHVPVVTNATDRREIDQYETDVYLRPCREAGKYTAVKFLDLTGNHDRTFRHLLNRIETLERTVNELESADLDGRVASLEERIEKLEADHEGTKEVIGDWIQDELSGKN
jgi:DNA-directed RNA polymerase subunit RPC12/RpoP